jgi:hypothetical protein
MDARREALQALSEAEKELATLTAIHHRLYESFEQLLKESFSEQYLELQSQMQSENRSFTAVSNIMKTKHDTVKNSINNIH